MRWRLISNLYDDIVYKNNDISSKFIEALKFEEFGQKVYRKEDFELEDM